MENKNKSLKLFKQSTLIVSFFYYKIFKVLESLYCMNPFYGIKDIILID